MLDRLESVAMRAVGITPKMACAALALVALIAVAVPGVAWADIGTDINNWLCDACNNMGRTMAGVASDLTSALAAGTILSQMQNGGLANLLAGVYAFADAVNANAVRPLAYCVLALSMVLQFIKITQRADGSMTGMPGLENICMLLVGYIIAKLFIDNSMQICDALYRTAGQVMAGITAQGQVSGQIMPDTAFTYTDLGICVILLIICVLQLGCAFVTHVIAQLLVYGRAIQIYVFAAFSALPIAMLGVEMTRDSGFRFVKSFASIVLANALLLVVLYLFPTIISSIGYASLGPSFDIGSQLADALGVFAQWLALMLVMVVAMCKTGGWAKEILGAA